MNELQELLLDLQSPAIALELAGLALCLALAAGLSLPLLSWWGYSPGTRDEQGLQALAAAYGFFPCALKLLAALLLIAFWRSSKKHEEPKLSQTPHTTSRSPL